MAATGNKSAEFTLTLTEEERIQLLSWLEQRMHDKLIEEHRTDAPDFKSFVAHQEVILDDLIRKLRR